MNYLNRVPAAPQGVRVSALSGRMVGTPSGSLALCISAPYQNSMLLAPAASAPQRGGLSPHLSHMLLPARVPALSHPSSTQLLELGPRSRMDEC